MSSQLRATDPLTVRLASGKVQLIEFFAFWDGTSLAMAPIIHGLEARYHDQMKFIYLDIDDPATLYFQKELGYHLMPHFFLVDGAGGVLNRWQGYVSVEQLTEAIETALGE